MRSTIECCPFLQTAKIMQNFFFGAKHLEKGLNRAGGEIFGAPFSKKVPFFHKKVPFLANIERSPKFLEYPLLYIL